MKTQETFERMCFQIGEDEKERKDKKEKRKIEKIIAPIKEGDYPVAYIH